MGRTTSGKGRTERIHQRGLDLARAVLQSAGCELKDLDARHLRTNTPWRDDRTPSLDVLKGADSGAPAGSWIDRATGEKGDAIDLAARLWGLDCKRDFLVILERCEKTLGISTPWKNPTPKVETRAFEESDLRQLAAAYGLEWSDFERAGCTASTASFFPSLRQKAPCIVYPAAGAEGERLEKSKTLYRYDGSPDSLSIVPHPRGKRHSAGKGTGWFPRGVFEGGEGGDVIVVTGGEEKALVALKAGFRAVSYTHGEKAPKREEAAVLRRAGFSKAIVAFDADAAGRKGAGDCARLLALVGFEVRVLQWPEGTPDKWDLCDVARERGLDALRELIESATPAPKERPRLVVNGRQRRELAEEVKRGLIAANVGLYVHHGKLAKLELERVGSEERRRFRVLDKAGLVAFVIRVFDVVVEVKGGDRPAERVPPDIPEDILANPEGFPQLDAIAHAPFVTSSGLLVTRPGYNEEARVFLDSDLALGVRVAENPTREQVEAAVELLTEPFREFPFADRASLAHVLAVMVTVPARRLINGPTPLFLIGAPTPGSGKSLVANAISLASTWTIAAMSTLPRVEAEVQKTLFSIGLKGTPLVVLDNLDSDLLTSSSLAATITSTVFEDRLLGGNVVQRIELLSVWIGTGNAVQLSKELTRRTVLIELVPDHARPWERDGWRHPDLLGYVRESRPLMMAALLTLVRAWIAAGRPKSSRAMGSFESWCSVVGGILDVAGVEGFLENRPRLFDTADAEGASWNAFLSAWWDRYATGEASPKDLAELARQRDLLGEIVDSRGSQSIHSVTSRMGIKLRRSVGRVSENGLVVRSREARHGNLYRLEQHRARKARAEGADPSRSLHPQPSAHRKADGMGAGVVPAEGADPFSQFPVCVKDNGVCDADTSARAHMRGQIGKNPPHPPRFDETPHGMGLECAEGCADPARTPAEGSRRRYYEDDTDSEPEGFV